MYVQVHERFENVKNLEIYKCLRNTSKRFQEYEESDKRLLKLFLKATIVSFLSMSIGILFHNFVLLM